MNKKGMSPLIATVVLIAFAVALGAVIMNISSSVVEQNTNMSYKCGDLSFSVHKFSDGSYDICYSETSIVFTAEMTRGSINGLKLVAYTSGSSLFTEPDALSERLTVGGPKKIVIPFNKAVYGGIAEIKMWPILGQGDDAHLCDNAPFLISEVPMCK